MFLWIFILVGAGVCWLLRDRSLYSNWTTLFNVAASIYTSVMLAPLMLGLLPDGTKWLGYNCAGMVLLLSVVLFVVLEIVAAYVIVVEEVNVEFPRAIELIGSKAAGFFSGFCTAGLLIFLVTVILMQYEYKPWMKVFRTKEGPVKTVVLPVEKACGVIGHASLQLYPTDAPKNVISELMSLEIDNEKTEPEVQKKTEEFPDFLPD